jgi:exonuclease VII large subunit
MSKGMPALVRPLCSIILVASLLFPAPSHAVQVAPRISDREIIESLAELKAGQKSLQQQISDLKESTQQQINDLRQSTQQQISDLRQSTQQQISDLRQEMNQRFDDMNRRFDDVITLLQILIGALVVVLGGMLAWLIAIWRRLVRVEERQKAFETQDDEIKFLKESVGRLQEMFVQLVARLPR